MKIYDFYYSEKQFKHCKSFQNDVRSNYSVCKFKGKTYTECVESGQNPISKFDDLVKIGTGRIIGNVTVDIVKQ